MPISEIFNIDCYIGMRKYANHYFDLAVCDIPYGIDAGKMAFLTERKTTVKQKNGTKLNPRKNTKPYTLKEWDKHPPDQCYFDELCRVSKHQIIFGVDYVNWTGLGTGRIKWDKGVPDGVSFNRYENAYCSLIDHEIDLPLLWSGMQQASSLNTPMRQQGNKKLNEKRIHPTHKPVLLYQKLLADYAQPGFKILDTHLGGGSSRIATYKAGLDFTGFEIDEEYFEKHQLRWKQFMQQLSLQF